MPPKRHIADKKQQAAAQDSDEIQIRPGSHWLDSPGLTGLGTGPGLPGSKPEWLEAVLDGLTNKIQLTDRLKTIKSWHETIKTRLLNWG